VTARATPKSATHEPKFGLAISIGSSLAFGLLSVLFAVMVVAQSHTIAYVDETTGHERAIYCGSMLAPAIVPEDVPLEIKKLCADSTQSFLQAIMFAVFAGVLMSNTVRGVRRWRQV